MEWGGHQHGGWGVLGCPVRPEPGIFVGFRFEGKPFTGLPSLSITQDPPRMICRFHPGTVPKQEETK